MKNFLRNLPFPTFLASILCIYAPIILPVPIIVSIFNSKCSGNEEILGKLEVMNRVYDPTYDFGNWAVNIVHYNQGTEGFDSGIERIYGPFFNPSGKSMKIVSRIPGYELRVDIRPLDSFTPVNLELAISTQWGGPFTFSNWKNELNCSFPLANTPPYFATFGSKPITLWGKSIIDPNSNPNDPNNYTLSFMADVREAMEKNGGVIPLPDLNGTYGSEVAYMYGQIRFDVYPGNLNFGLDADGNVLDGIVDMKDLAILGNDWGKQGQPLEFVGDITGAQGLPDGKVDYQDLELLARYWLKDIRDIMPSP